MTAGSEQEQNQHGPRRDDPARHAGNASTKPERERSAEGADPKTAPTVVPDELTDSLPPAPSLANAAPRQPQSDITALGVGDVFMDFQVQRLLGKGAFGSVYLALQLSLNRLVAIKVARNVGAEGRTMARLEHPNIVQVFAEQPVAGRPLRLLCMQFVAGPTLRELLDQLHRSDTGNAWNGERVLQLIDEHVDEPTRLLPDEYGNRTQLEVLTRAEVVCFWGAQLAEGLAFAHASNVLHHDIKPANILLNASGRPLLADFNLAESVTEDQMSATVGGTLLYMAPEQLARFIDRTAATALAETCPSAAVDRTADIYSLGLVLTELLSGRLPMAEPPEAARDSQSDPRRNLQLLLQLRSQPLIAEAGTDDPDCETARTVVAVLSRACHPKPHQRTQSARLLADELRGCLRIGQLHRSPTDSNTPLQRFAMSYSLATLLILTALPHVVGSFVNIAYNTARVADLPGRTVDTPGGSGESAEVVLATFHQLTLWYNVLVWPVCIVLLTGLVMRNRGAIQGLPFPTADTEADGRRRLIQLPRQMSLVAMLGWSPGLIVFPTGLALLADVPLWSGLTHFGINLLMSGSIAFSYSYMAAVWLVMSICYPRLWRFPAELSAQAVKQETRPLLQPLRACRVAAGFVPLISAILLVVISPSDTSGSQYTIFRALLAILIAAGMLGYHFSVRITDTLAARLNPLNPGSG